MSILSNMLMAAAGAGGGGDPQLSDVEFLINLGTNDTAYSDNLTLTKTNNGVVVADGYGLFDAAGDYLGYARSAVANYKTGNVWAFECFFELASDANDCVLYGTNTVDGTAPNFTNQLCVSLSKGGAWSPPGYWPGGTSRRVGVYGFFGGQDRSVYSDVIISPGVKYYLGVNSAANGTITIAVGTAGATTQNTNTTTFASGGTWSDDLLSGFVMARMIGNYTTAGTYAFPGKIYSMRHTIGSTRDISTVPTSDQFPVT